MHSSLRAAAITSLAAPFFFAALASAAGVNYDVSIISNQSSIESTTNLAAPLAGTFMGDYDAVTNPTGTKTLPGFFGGSGNNPIGYSASLVADGSFTSAPTGGFAMNIDTRTLTFTVSELGIDFLAGAPASIDAILNITYSTFHTQNPNAIFPSIGTLPLPLGSANFTELTATQTGPAVAGVLIPAGKNSYTFVTAVPIDLLATIEANGQTFGGTPVPFALPLAGTVTFGGENVVISLTGTAAFDQKQPIDPPLTFTDLAFALPTVLPPGGIANLLFGGSISSASLAQSISLDILADAAAQLPPGDLNGDGVVNARDLAILLGAWGTSGPGDLNNDGIVNAADLAILLGDWS